MGADKDYNLCFPLKDVHANDGFMGFFGKQVQGLAVKSVIRQGADITVTMTIDEKVLNQDDLWKTLIPNMPENAKICIVSLSPDIVDIVTELNKRGIPVTWKPTGSIDIRKDYNEKIFLIDDAPENEVWNYLSQEYSCLNPFASAYSVENRYILARLMQQRVILRNMTPYTQFFDNKEQVEAFLNANEDKPFAVKEWQHLGSGSTLMKLQAPLTDKDRYGLHRASNKYPFVVQDWLDHDPKKQYLRVLRFGNTLVAKKPLNPEKVNGQTATAFIEEKNIPRDIDVMSKRFNNIMGLFYSSGDYVFSDHKWYMVDIHAENTDILSYFAFPHATDLLCREIEHLRD